MPEGRTLQRSRPFGLLLAAALALGAASAARAQTGAWLEEMSRLEAQIQLQQRRSELQRLLREEAQRQEVALPAVLAVMAGRNGWRALLRHADGRESLLQAGDEWAPGETVTRPAGPPGDPAGLCCPRLGPDDSGPGRVRAHRRYRRFADAHPDRGHAVKPASRRMLRPCARLSNPRRRNRP
jgi:hypothetical protein